MPNLLSSVCAESTGSDMRRFQPPLRRLLARAIVAYMDSPRRGVLDMANIITDPDSTAKEAAAAIATLCDAISFPQSFSQIEVQNG